MTKRKLSAKALKTAKHSGRTIKPKTTVIGRKTTLKPVADSAVIAPVVEETASTDEDSAALNQLLELGRNRGMVTYDDILRFFPDAERDIEQLEETYVALQSAGIELVDIASVDDEPSDEDMEEAEEEENTLRDLSQDDTYLSAIDADDTIGLYLKEIGRVPLLVAAEEVALAKRMEKMKFARERLAKGGKINPKRRANLQWDID
ncbi:MAG: RNA polymerase sigma factor region1.1 domain-containing protein, partial [Chloroflexota bacterium]